MSVQDHIHLYKAELEINDDDDPHFSEGAPIDFSSGGTFYNCEVVEYDYANSTLFFSCNREIFVDIDSRVISDASFNTEALKNLLGDIAKSRIDPSLPLYKFINGTTRDLKVIHHNKYPEYIDKWLERDESQRKAFAASLSRDITFLWGPPGTGKSYTLAAIIMALYYMKGERTAVCCLSNVAVDQLLEKVLEIIETHEPNMPTGQFYRAGRTSNNRIIATDFLYPNDRLSDVLRLAIKAQSEIIKQYKGQEAFSDEAIEEKAKLTELRKKLKDHTDVLISQVNVVFSTISNFVINSRLKDSTFDNLIVDEASMLAQPQLIALARKVKKRIILVGDFQQLAPITTAGVPILRNNVFKLCGIDIDHINHLALHQLLNQRRSNPKIVDIINHAFYLDRLHAENKKYNPIIEREPFNGCVIGMKCVSNGCVRFTKGGTRQNVFNSDAVMELLDIYAKEESETFDIGVITPYSGQVALIKKKFFDRKYVSDFEKRVKIGTVHTFQGSESDVIIFDMVDCSKFEKGKPYFGKLYAGEQGEQLLNVAVSRARHKLLVVCDPQFIEQPPGDKVTKRTFSVFNSLLKAKNTRQ